MNLVLLLALVALATWWSARLVLAVHRDGLGTRRPPASHHDWTEGAEGVAPPSHR